MRTIYWVWSMLLFAAIVLQVGFAGYGAFYAAHKLDDEGSTIDDDVFLDGFGIHVGFGYLVVLLGLVFVAIGVIAGIGRWRLGRHGAHPAGHPCLDRLRSPGARVPPSCQRPPALCAGRVDRLGRVATTAGHAEYGTRPLRHRYSGAL